MESVKIFKEGGCLTKKVVGDDFDASSNIDDYLKGDLYWTDLTRKRVRRKKKR